MEAKKLNSQKDESYFDDVVADVFQKNDHNADGTLSLNEYNVYGHDELWTLLNNSCSSCTGHSLQDTLHIVIKDIALINTTKFWIKLTQILTCTDCIMQKPK